MSCATWMNLIINIMCRKGSRLNMLLFPPLHVYKAICCSSASILSLNQSYHVLCVPSNRIWPFSSCGGSCRFFRSSRWCRQQGSAFGSYLSKGTRNRVREKRGSVPSDWAAIPLVIWRCCFSPCLLLCQNLSFKRSQSICMKGTTLLTQKHKNVQRALYLSMK